MKYIILIGDIVNSRDNKHRDQLQRGFQQCLATLNRSPKGMVSPYTITLGDEFQVVLTDGNRAISDAIKIQAALHPTKIRFSFAIGELTTPINKKHAIGMDGPAFYSAREGIDELKESGALFQINGFNQPTAELANTCLKLVSNTVERWKNYRWDIMVALGEKREVKEIAADLGISDKAVYKSISDGHIKDVMHALNILGAMMDETRAERSQ